ncbi:MAG: hypothetical protein AAGI30_04060 [Planctomycetota bacterium]
MQPPLRLVYTAALVGASPAFAGATFTFDDPGPGAEFQYTPDGNSGALEYVGSDVELVIEDDDGLMDGFTFPTFSETADFFFSGVVTNVQVIPLPFMAPFNQIIIGEISADFEWRLPGDGEVILSGTFTTGNVTLTPSGFNISANDTSQLSYFIGPALEDAGLGGIEFAPIADANWTLTGALFGDGGSNGQGPPPPPNFNPFSANSAFSGTATVIPGPGLATMGGLIGVATLSRRRRR